MNKITLDNDITLPYKFTRKALSDWEEKTKVRLAEFDVKGTINHQMLLCYEAYKAGMRLEGKQNEVMKYEEFMAIDEAEGFMDQMWSALGEDQKKQPASSEGS